MSVDAVRADINEAIQRIRLEGCAFTMRSALLFWKQYLAETQPYGLSLQDKQGYAMEHKRIDWLLSEIFPDEEEVSDEADVGG